MDGQSLNLDGILQSVMQNPEMLKSAMELAGKLSEGGGLSSLLSLGGSDTPAEQQEAPEEKEAEQTLAIAPAKSEKKVQNDMWRHRKLIEALSLYVSDDKRDLFDLIIKLFDIVELTNHIKH